MTLSDAPEPWVRALRHAVRGGTPDAYGDPFTMRLYILDPNGRPVHVLDGHSHYRFLKDGFRRFVLRTDLPYQGAHVWTCFSPWSDARGDIPVFLTHLKGPSVDKVFTSSSWEEAQEKHRRVAEKAQRVLPAQKS